MEEITRETRGCEHETCVAGGRIQSGLRVSVVVPAYNAQDTIERAINSIYAQTYDDIHEIIVVDDGSTDGTADIVRSRYPEVTVIQQANTGSPTARNRGVEASSGEYVAFLDDDDEWLPEKTALQMGCFRAYPGLVMTTTESLTDDQPSPVDDSDGLLQTLAFDTVFPRIPFHCGCSGWIVRRTAFDQCGGFAVHMRRGQDTEWMLRALLLGFSLGLVTIPLFRYYGRSRRQEAEKTAEMVRKRHQVLSPIVESYGVLAAQYPARLSHRQVDRKIAEYYWAEARELWRWGLATEARECLSRCSARSKALGLRLLCSLAHGLPGPFYALQDVLVHGAKGAVQLLPGGRHLWSRIRSALNRYYLV